MLQGGCKTTAHHIAQHIEDDHVGVFQQMVFFQELDGLTHHIAAAAGASGWATGLDAHHTVVALKHKVFYAQLFGMKVHGFKHINHRGQHFFGERESAVVLGVTTDLQHPLAQSGKGGRQVRRCGALTNTAFAVNGKDFGIADLDAGVELHLHAALAVRASAALDLVDGDGGGFNHGDFPVGTSTAEMSLGFVHGLYRDLREAAFTGKSFGVAAGFAANKKRYFFELFFRLGRPTAFVAGRII